MRRLRPIKITGFVVNIHDSINFDIDFDFNSELQHIYRSVVKKSYEYISLTDHDIYDLNLDLKEKEVNKRYAYRCRIKGVAINKKCKSNKFHMYSSKLIQEIKNLINSCDSWVVCNIYDIDIHDRLLIDLKIPFNNEIIDVKEFILNKATTLSNIYVEYK